MNYELHCAAQVPYWHVECRN